MDADKYSIKQNFDINSRRRERPWSMKAFHYHDSYELYYLAGGSRRILVQDRIYELNAGDAVLFKPNIFHRSMNSGAHIRYNIEFTSEFMRDYFTEKAAAELLSCFDTEYIRLERDECTELERLFRAARSEYESGGIFYISFAGILKLLCSAAVRVPLKPAQPLTKASRTLQPVIEYINKSYAHIDGIDEIAAQCYLNKSYLCRLFKKETGMTLTQYINNVRIQRACDMISDTELDMTEIALRCGFSSAAYFSSMFKAEVKCTPTEFRSFKRSGK